MRTGKRSAGAIFGHVKRRHARLSNGPVMQVVAFGGDRFTDACAYRSDVVSGWRLLQMECHLRSRF